MKTEQTEIQKYAERAAKIFSAEKPKEEQEEKQISASERW